MIDQVVYQEAPALSQDRPIAHQQAARCVNVSQGERWISCLGGSALILAGLSRRNWSGLLLATVGGALAYRGWTGHCHGYDALGISTAQRGPATTVPAHQGVKVEKAFAVNRTPSELFRFWRDVTNLPRVMRHLISVEEIDAHRSRWKAKGPLGMKVEWEAEIFNEREPELIAWRSLPGGQIETAGSIHFQSLPHDRGTAVIVSMKYNPPAGKIGAKIASLLGSGLDQELEEDLRRFKSVMETGEAPIS